MNKIKSFLVDHTILKEGIYISRIDGDCITYDLRFCRPNSGILLDNSSIHTTEHMLATFLRNSDIADSVIYFGPMGCQTGFYLIVRNNIASHTVLNTIKDCLEKTINYTGEVFGASEKECGNYINLDINHAKKVCAPYRMILDEINEIITYEDLK